MQHAALNIHRDGRHIHIDMEQVCPSDPCWKHAVRQRESLGKGRRSPDRYWKRPRRSASQLGQDIFLFHTLLFHTLLLMRIVLSRFPSGSPMLIPTLSGCCGVTGVLETVFHRYVLSLREGPAVPNIRNVVTAVTSFRITGAWEVWRGNYQVLIYCRGRGRFVGTALKIFYFFSGLHTVSLRSRTGY